MKRGALRTATTSVALALAAVSASACGDDGEPAPVDLDAAVYTGGLRWVIDEADLGEREPDDRRLYVESRQAGEDIPLEAQVAVVRALEDEAVVRFVDDRAEAVEEEEPGRPVRREGVLIGLGAPERRGETAALYLDLYRGEGTVRAFRLTLREGDDGWRVTEHRRAAPRPA